MEDFIVKESNIDTNGLFANRDYLPDELVMSFQGNPPKMIYINHSCEPSCYTIEPVKDDYQTHTLHAGKWGLKEGQEITYDYRLGQDLDYFNNTISDNCNCEKCRG
jgi:SET domain-containing protein